MYWKTKLFDKHSINAHYAGGRVGIAYFLYHREHSLCQQKSQPWTALLFYIRLYFNTRNSKVLPKHPVFLCCVSTTKKWESSNRVHVEIYIKKKTIFIFHNSPKTFSSQPVSPDKLSLNGNREASRDVSSGV